MANAGPEYYGFSIQVDIQSQLFKPPAHRVLLNPTALNLKPTPNMSLQSKHEKEIETLPGFRIIHSAPAVQVAPQVPI